MTTFDSGLSQRRGRRRGEMSYDRAQRRERRVAAPCRRLCRAACLLMWLSPPCSSGSQLRIDKICAAPMPTADASRPAAPVMPSAGTAAAAVAATAGLLALPVINPHWLKRCDAGMNRASVAAMCRRSSAAASASWSAPSAPATNGAAAPPTAGEALSAMRGRGGAPRACRRASDVCSATVIHDRRKCHLVRRRRRNVRKRRVGRCAADLVRMFRSHCVRAPGGLPKFEAAGSIGQPGTRLLACKSRSQQ